MAHTGSRFSHAVCDSCFFLRHHERPLVRLRTEYREIERCCWCGEETLSGAYERANPDELTHCPERKVPA